jgi:RND family efflux transporter MFP subunit
MMVTQRRGVGLSLGVGAIVLSWGLAGCQPATGTAAPKAAAPPAPAKVSAPLKEDELATIKLTPEAEQRLAISLAKVEPRPLPLVTSYGGEVIVPPGRLIIVSAPLTGTLQEPKGAKTPAPGSKVKKGQPIFLLVPILAPESRATLTAQLSQAEGQMKQAKEQLNNARDLLERAQHLKKNNLGGTAAVVDAQNQFNLAQTSLRAAQDWKTSIEQQLSPDAASGQALTIEAPADGILQNEHAQIGQKVGQNAQLFQVDSLDPMWIKVPVYVGEVSRIATDRPAGIGGLADPPGAPQRPAKPVTAPPQGDPIAYTVNLFYEVENSDGSFHPGQRVGVTLPLKGKESPLAVPISSLIRDIQGGVWVYEKTAPHTFARRRVFIDRVVGDLAALGTGPKAGAEVVSVGAAELFGTEFGGGK